MEKRERSNNFSEKEKELLFSVISQQFSVIENKKTDAVSVKEKNVAWSKIAEHFNALNDNGIRSVNQLKTAYFNFKRKLKKDQADDRIEFYKTGGGPPAQAKMDDNKLKLVDLLKPHLEPIISRYDSSANYSSIPEAAKETCCDEDMNIIAVEEIPVIIEEPSCSSSNQSCSSNKQYTTPQMKRKRTMSDVYNDVHEFTSKKTNNIELIRKKNEIELDLLKLKIEKENNQKIISDMKVEEGKIDLEFKKIMLINFQERERERQKINSLILEQEKMALEIKKEMLLMLQETRKQQVKKNSIERNCGL